MQRFNIFLVFLLHNHLTSSIKGLQLNSQFQNVVKIDLSQCLCSTANDCDFTILKSSLMEINCSEGENLCCSMITENKIEANSSSINANETAQEVKPSPVTNIRVYTINALHSDASIAERNSAEKVKSKTKSNCRCKERSSCPQKYVDYGFGFHCSYSTIRCCIPEGEAGLYDRPETVEATQNDKFINPISTSFEIADAVIQSDLNSDSLKDRADEESQTTVQSQNIANDAGEIGQRINADVEAPSSPVEEDQAPFELSQSQEAEGELMITEITDWSDNDSNKELQCMCLSINQCRMVENDSENSIERRRDTLCPGDTIQCCGFDIMEEITKKRDDVGVTETEYLNAPVNQEAPFQQPVQLPESNLADTQNQTEETFALNSYNEQMVAPPALPNQYQNYDYTNYNQGYNYPANSYPTMLSGPQTYQNGGYQTSGQNIQPWVSLASPSSHQNYDPRGQMHGYPRGHYPMNGNGQSKPSKPGGLFERLSQLIG